jgi:hypothetical protein
MRCLLVLPALLVLAPAASAQFNPRPFSFVNVTQFAPANPVGVNSSGAPAANLGYPYGGAIPINPSPFAYLYGGYYGGGYGYPAERTDPFLARGRDLLIHDPGTVVTVSHYRSPSVAEPAYSGATEVALTLPAGAEVRVQGGQLTGSGSSRLVTVDPAGGPTVVNVVVKWQADGKPVEQSFAVNTAPGQRSSLCVLR